MACTSPAKPLTPPILVESSSISWDDIFGHEDIKRELQESMQFVMSSSNNKTLLNSAFMKFGMRPSRGILLYGFSGCGKTLLAKAAAHECGAKVITVDCPELIRTAISITTPPQYCGGGDDDDHDGDGDGDGDVYLNFFRDIFDMAREVAPCIIYLKDFDAIVDTRESICIRFANQFLTEIDGLPHPSSSTSSITSSKVFLIGSSTRPDLLQGTTFLRPGRLDQLIFVPLPDCATRLDIIKANFKHHYKIAPDVDLQRVADVTSHFSGADLFEMCKRVCKEAISNDIPPRTISGADSQSDVEHALVSPVSSLSLTGIISY